MRWLRWQRRERSRAGAAVCPRAPGPELWAAAGPQVRESRGR